VIDNIKKHSKQAFLPPLLHVKLLLILVLYHVLVGVRVSAKHNSLANKVEYIASATEASIASAEAVQRAKLINSSVIIVSVIKYKVA
jgi:hypothetical protein